MAREAVCSSTHQANGMRPLYANEARRTVIGSVNSPVSIIPAREPLKEEEEEEERGGTSVRVPFAHSLLRSTRSTCQNLQITAPRPKSV